MSRAVDSERAILAAAAQSSSGSSTAAVTIAATATAATEAIAAMPQRPVADPHEADSGSEGRAPGSRGQRLAREDGQRRAGCEHEDPRHRDEACDERRLPGVGARIPAPEPHKAPDGEAGEHRAPAERPSDTRAEVGELERAGAVRGVRAVERGRDEEQPALDRRDPGRGESDAEVDAVAREGERHELGREGARGDRVGER